jgi:hypothetical protein
MHDKNALAPPRRLQGRRPALAALSAATGLFKPFLDSNASLSQCGQMDHSNWQIRSPSKRCIKIAQKLGSHVDFHTHEIFQELRSYLKEPGATNLVWIT